MYIELFYIITAFLFLLYYPGYGITRLIIPDRFREFELLIIPFVGLSVILSSAHIFSFLGLGSSVFTWLVVVFITPLNVYALRKKGLPGLNLSETIPVVLMSVAVFIVGMLPLFYEGYLTVVGTNGDAVHYTLLADHFISNGLEPPKDKGLWITNWIAFLLSPANARLGPMYFQSMVGAITGLEGYKTFTVIINLFHAALILSTYIFIRTLGLLTRNGSIFAIALIAINSSLYWLCINDYMGQVMMLSGLPLALSSSFFMIEERSYKSLLFSIIISSCILLTSAESIVLLLGPLVIYLAIVVYKREVLFIDTVKFSTLWLSLLVAINILPLMRPIQLVYGLIFQSFEKGFSRVQVGDVGYFIPITQIFGLTPPYHPLYREMISNPDYASTAYLAYFYGSYIVVSVLLSLIAYTLLFSEKKIMLASFFISYFVMTLYFRLTIPYGYFKITSSLSFIAIVLISTGIWSVISDYPYSFIKWGVLTVAASIVILSLISTYVLFDLVINDSNEEWVTINKELIALKNVQKRLKNAPVLIEDRLGRGNKYYWIGYLMQDREVLTRKAIMGTEIFQGKELTFDYVIDGGYRYEQYMAEGWVPVLSTSRYVLLERGRQ